MRADWFLDGPEASKDKSGEGLFGEMLRPDPSSLLLGGDTSLSCNLLLHLGMARCHVPSSWQTAVKDRSACLPCLIRDRGAVSTRRCCSSLPVLAHTGAVGMQSHLSSPQNFAPMDVAPWSFFLASPFRPDLHMGTHEPHSRKSDLGLVVRPNNPLSRFLPVSTEVQLNRTILN